MDLKGFPALSPLLLLLVLVLLLLPTPSHGFGTNVMSFPVTVSNGNIGNNGKLTSTNTVSGLPFTKMDWTVAVVLTPYLTFNYPEDLTIMLCDPSKYCAYVAYDGDGLNCENFFNGVPIYDNNTYYSGTSSSYSCSTTISPWTANHKYYFDNTGGQYQGQNSFVGGSITYPFAGTFATDTANGQWVLQITDNNPVPSVPDSGTLASWTLQFYS